MSEREQRFVFGEVAEEYDRYRPSYPTGLVDDVLEFAALPERGRAVEVGCGTGRATVLFAARGVELVGLEPTEAMAALARRNCERFPHVAIDVTTFEDWEPRGRYDLLLAAQAWHWVAADVRCVKAHRVLAPGGTLAVFWNVTDWQDTPLRRAMDESYARHAPSMGDRSVWTGAGVQSAYAEEVERSGLFGPVDQREHRWAATYSAADWVELLATASDHRMLPPDQRHRLFDAIAADINAAGGKLVVDFVTKLYLTRALG